MSKRRRFRHGPLTIEKERQQVIEGYHGERGERSLNESTQALTVPDTMFNFVSRCWPPFYSLFANELCESRRYFLDSRPAEKLCQEQNWHQPHREQDEQNEQDEYASNETRAGGQVQIEPLDVSRLRC